MTACEALRLNNIPTEQVFSIPLCPRSSDCSIHRHPFFQDLGDEDIAALCQNSRRHSFMGGETLCHEGDPADRFYIVLSGTVKLFRLTDKGNERVVGSVGPDEVLGEIAACSPGGTYPWYAQCLKNTQVRAFSGAQLQRMVSRRSDYMMNVMRYVSVAVSRSTEEQAMLAAPNAQVRLAQYLLRLIPHDDGRDANIEVTLPVPKGVLASRLAMQPETLSRMLRALSDQQLVDAAHRQIIIRDRQGLEEVTG